MVEYSKTEILICPNHGPISNRNARCYVDKYGIAISVCPACGRELEFVGIEEVEGIGRRKSMPGT